MDKNKSLFNKNYVLTNHISSDLSSKYILTPQALILGHLQKEDDEKLDLYSDSLVVRWKSIIDKYKDRPVFLLYSGDDQTLSAIHDLKIFDEIITANTRPIHEQPDQIEKQRPGLLHRGNGIYMVPSYSQGLLLGGLLRSSVSKIHLFSSTKSQPKQSISPAPQTSLIELDSINLFLWLDRSFEHPEALMAEYNQYNNEQNNAFDILASKRLNDLADTKFMSAQTCQGCHASAYEVWEHSAHSHAHQTLVDKSKNKDADCIACHVLGFNEVGGFVNMEHSPQFANVQCENCHGPANEHLQNPTRGSYPTPDPKQMCVSCHHPPHTTDFDFAKYWPKIKHGFENTK